MRIGIDTQSTMGRKTGIGSYTVNLLAALRKIAPDDEFVELNWGRDVVMRTDRRLRWQQWGLGRAARKAVVELLHVPGFDAPLWKPCPVVLTVHDLIGILFPENLPLVSRLYWSRWLPFTVRFADAIIADSECTRRDIVRLLHVPDERIRVIYPGVGKSFRPQSARQVDACRLRYSLPKDYILYVGTIEPRKGVATIVEALARTRARHHLVIAGKCGWYWGSVLRRIAALNLEQQVHVLDYVPDADLPRLYSGAKAFVFPSRYEGFGLPVLEAMACGCPVICSSTSSLPEVVGDAALLVAAGDPEPLAEAIDLLLESAHLQQDLRERGLRRAGRFTWEDAARLTLEVYGRVAAGELRVAWRGT